MTQNSNGYDARQHLVQIRSKDGTMKDYLPANWRLYQARLEHPDIVLESEILHLDPEHNFVIVKALVFVGVDYASATLKCSAMKQGLLTQLDRVETAAKARALRDLGISTELALDHDDSDADAPAPSGGQDEANGDTLAEQMAALKADFEQLYPEKAGIWNAVLTRQFGKLPVRWTPEHLVRMKGYYLQCVEKVTARRAAQTDAA